MDSTEGPVLPTEEWAEDQVLQSGSGWIEMDKQCLTDESVALLQFSQAYSPVFRVVLPTSHVPSTPPPPSLSTSRPSSPEPRQPDPPLKVLPTLSPLFPPPPFIPSHPTFDHLSAVAQQRSDQLRKNAEERLSRVVEACVSEIEKEEEELRRQVQLLWSAFREAESVIGQETNLQSPDKRTATADSAVTDSLSHTSQGSKCMSPVTVSDFVPVSTVRSPSPTREPHPSALSTSLAVSSFHHPKASGEEGRSASPIATTLSSPLPTSPTLVGSVNYRDPVRRDMNENKDIATSFKEKQRARQYQSLSDVKSPRVNKLAGNPNPTVPDGAVEHPEPMAGPSTSKNNAPPEVISSPSGSKGKRKVTFDIKPVVPRGEGETQVNEEPSEASIFELEDDNSDAASERDTLDGLTLTLRESVDNPTRPFRQPRSSGGSALPQSLQSLRPTSLPAPVALRASDLPQPQPEATLRRNVTPPATTEDTSGVDKVLSPRDQELARLVNVTTPSHRNAWKRDTQSWKLFGSGNAGDASPESLDSEADSTAALRMVESNGKNGPFNSGISASVPISIALTPRDHAEIGSHDESDARPEPALTSASYRKASYAARDRSRSEDPGALDFEAVDDDENLDGDDGDTGSLSRGRRRALKILQARSELPAEGMWRSLAS
ncbi:hypothetical protein BGY98DRAFT_1096506 [Russula aff. rugulosa BPL654]|nr:hypothetical protein BGY98DRAFT_1096506 [Russula aff. rugulosa BPL654]